MLLLMRADLCKVFCASVLSAKTLKPYTSVYPKTIYPQPHHGNKGMEHAMKKTVVAALAAAIIVIIAVSVVTAIQLQKPATNTPTSTPTPTAQVEVAPKKPFYVGVTYCGNSTTEAQQLIDKVKGYTNLFVVQSGPLMSNLPDLEQICDYAVAANLSLIVYFARNGDANNVYRSFLNIAPDRWGNNLLGIYFNDEPGGKMIDVGLILYDNSTGGTITSSPSGPVSQWIPEQPGQNQYSYTFYPGDAIAISRCQTYPDQSSVTNDTVYYLNGTITLSTRNMSATGIGTSRTLRFQPNAL